MSEAVIKIKGTQRSAGEEPSVIELETVGKYTFGDETTLDYSESELTGMEGTNTRVAVTEEGVTITRSGSAEMQMMFREGKRNWFLYNTPYGASALNIDTRLIRGDFNKYGGALELRYKLFAEDTLISTNELEIKVRNI